MPFENVKLNDGHQIPMIGFGTGTVNRTKPVEEVTELVIQAIEAGFTHIDSAQNYHNETSVAEAIRKSRSTRNELYITTKYWTGPIQLAFHDSLARLGLNYVDLYLVHTPEAVEGNFEGAWREFEKIKADGLAKSIGVSNFNVEQLEAIVEIAKIKPVINQVELHPYNYAKQKTLLQFAAKHQIIIEAFSSLTPITKLPGGPVDAPVNAAAKRLGITPTQVLLLWVKAKGAVIITTSSKKEHLTEYLAVADLPPLTKGEVAAIDEAGSKA